MALLTQFMTFFISPFSEPSSHAELSGINLRTLQQYEIRSKDINKASGDSINALAGALRCNFYDIMEL